MLDDDRLPDPVPPPASSHPEVLREELRRYEGLLIVGAPTAGPAPGRFADGPEAPRT